MTWPEMVWSIGLWVSAAIVAVGGLAAICIALVFVAAVLTDGVRSVIDGLFH